VLFIASRETKPHLIDEDRNAAVEFVRQQATEDRKHGGLVTRHRPASFTGVASSSIR
jgi:hypothetical protein